jgi:uncharacterized membrane protein
MRRITLIQLPEDPVCLVERARALTQRWRQLLESVPRSPIATMTPQLPNTQAVREVEVNVTEEESSTAQPNAANQATTADTSAAPANAPANAEPTPMEVSESAPTQQPPPPSSSSSSGQQATSSETTAAATSASDHVAPMETESTAVTEDKPSNHESGHIAMTAITTTSESTVS